MVEKNLKQNMEFVEKHKAELLKHHKNKFLLIYDKEVVGAYDNYVNAAAEGIRIYGIQADFLVHQLVETEPLNFVMESIL